MSIVHTMQMQQKVAKKLMAAIAMLLVATMLVGVTTYAWVTFSTAPEARELKTTVGANGYLEIALQSGTSTITGYERNVIREYSRLQPAVGMNAVDAANRMWGNTILIDDDTYALNYVKLLPARLNLTETYTLNTESFLTIPVFGTDGRMVEMDNTQRVYYNGSTFTTGMNLGVCVHGDAASTGSVGAKQVQKYYDREDFIVLMSQQLAEERANVYENLVTMMEETRADDLILLFDYLGSGTTVDGNDAKDAVTRLLDSLSDINVQIQGLLRYVLIAKAASDTTRFPPGDEEKMAELSELYSNFDTWTIDSISSMATSMGYTAIVGACNKVKQISTRIQAARTQLTNVSITQAMSNILKVGTDTFVYQNDVMLHATNANTVARALALRTVINDKNGDVKLANGILYYFASILGDYKVQLQNDEGFDVGLYVNGTGTNASNGKGYNCNPEVNKGYVYTLVSDILNYIREEEDDYGQIYSTVTEYDTINAYGYSIDLAFKSNESGSILLQQESLDRITGMTKHDSESIGRYNEIVQGSGSNMKFTFASDLTSAQVTGLMQSIYVVFFNQYNRIMAVASAGTVTVKNRTATADLVLWNYNTNDGILTTTSKKANQTITDITADTTLYVTAVVYLSGDAASSSLISATQATSLSGSINMQFSHSETLVPMNYQDFQQ